MIAIAILEFVQAILKREHLSRTYEAKRRWDEQQDEPWWLGRSLFDLAGRMNVRAQRHLCD